MSVLETLALLIVVLGIGVAGGVVGGNLVTQADLDQAGTERAEAQASFTEPNQVVIEFPALVRGRRVHCAVFADTKRKVSSILC